MFKFIIEVFCKDTIVGLSQFSSDGSLPVFKNKHRNLFRVKKNKYSLNNFTDPIVCRL